MSDTPTFAEALKVELDRIYKGTAPSAPIDKAELEAIDQSRLKDPRFRKQQLSKT